MEGKWGIGLGDTKQHLEIWRDGFIAPVLRLTKTSGEIFTFELVTGRVVSLPLKLLRKRYCSNIVTSWINNTPSPQRHDWRIFGDFLSRKLIWLQKQKEESQNSISSSDFIFCDSETDSDSNSDSNSDSESSLGIEEVKSAYSSRKSKATEQQTKKNSQTLTPPTQSTRILRSEPPPKRRKTSNTLNSPMPSPEISDSYEESEDSQSGQLSNLEIVTRIRNYWKNPENTQKSRMAPAILKYKIQKKIVSSLLYQDDDNTLSPAILKSRIASARPLQKGCNVPDSAWGTVKSLLKKGGVLENSSLKEFRYFDWENVELVRMIEILENYQNHRNFPQLVSSIKNLKVETKLIASIFSYYLDSPQRNAFDKKLKKQKKAPVSSGKCLISYINKVISFNELIEKFSKQVLQHKTTDTWSNEEFSEIMENVFSTFLTGSESSPQIQKKRSTPINMSIARTRPTRSCRVSRSEPEPKRRKVSNTSTTPTPARHKTPKAVSIPFQDMLENDDSIDSKESEAEETLLTNFEIVSRIRDYWRNPKNIQKSKSSNVPPVLNDSIHMKIVTEVLYHDYETSSAELLKTRSNSARLIENGCNIPNIVWPIMKELLQEGGPLESTNLYEFVYFDWCILDSHAMIIILEDYKSHKDLKLLIDSIKKLKAETKLLASAFDCYLLFPHRQLLDNALKDHNEAPITSGKCLIPYINAVTSFNGLLKRHEKKILQHTGTTVWNNGEFYSIIDDVLFEAMKKFSVSFENQEVNEPDKSISPRIQRHQRSKRSKPTGSSSKQSQHPIQSGEYSQSETDEKSDESDLEPSKLTNLEKVTHIRRYWRTPDSTRKSEITNCAEVLKDKFHEEIVKSILFNDWPTKKRLQVRLRNTRPIEKGCNIPDSVWPMMKILLGKGGAMEFSNLKDLSYLDWANLDLSRMLCIMERFQNDRNRKLFLTAVKNLKIETKLLASAFEYYLNSPNREEFDNTLEFQDKPFISSGMCLIPYIDEVSSFTMLCSKYATDITRHTGVNSWVNEEFSDLIENVLCDTINSMFPSTSDKNQSSDSDIFAETKVMRTKVKKPTAVPVEDSVGVNQIALIEDSSSSDGESSISEANELNVIEIESNESGGESRPETNEPEPNEHEVIEPDANDRDVIEIEANESGPDEPGADIIEIQENEFNEIVHEVEAIENEGMIASAVISIEEEKSSEINPYSVIFPDLNATTTISMEKEVNPAEQETERQNESDELEANEFDELVENSPTDSEIASDNEDGVEDKLSAFLVCYSQENPTVETSDVISISDPSSPTYDSISQPRAGETNCVACTSDNPEKIQIVTDANTDILDVADNVLDEFPAMNSNVTKEITTETQNRENEEIETCESSLESIDHNKPPNLEVQNLSPTVAAPEEILRSNSEDLVATSTIPTKTSKENAAESPQQTKVNITSSTKSKKSKKQQKPFTLFDEFF